MGWQARLRGHAFDLDTLTHLFREGEPTVGRDEEGFYLKSSKFELSEVTHVHERAKQLLCDVNGIALTLDPSYRPVELAGSYVSEEGHQSVVIEPATIEARAQVLTPIVEGQPLPAPPPRGPKYAAVAASNPRVAEALGYLVSGLSAVNLYKVYEVIDADVTTAGQSMRDKLWASRNELSRFRFGINDPAIIGAEARHARLSGDKPPNPMDLSEARRFLLDLMLKWMDSKLPQA